MASQVSYARAAQGVVLVIAADLYWNQGRTTSGIALGTLGSLCSEVYIRGKKVYDDFFENHKFGKYRTTYAYRFMKQLEQSNPVKQQTALCNALKDVQRDYPKIYQKFLKEEKLHSKKEILKYFTERLKKGCCMGRAGALFSKIVHGQCASLGESERLLQSKDIFYYQILDKLYPDTSEKAIRMEILKKEAEYIKACLNRLKGGLPIGKIRLGKTEKARIKAQIKKQHSKICTNLKKKHLTRGFVKSKEFPLLKPLDVYKRTLKSTTLKLAGKKDFIGVITMPRHVVSFQYGPRGYFLYDPVDHTKGLFKYPSNKVFFQELRKHVLDDVQKIKCSRLEERSDVKPEEMQKKVKEFVRKAKGHFWIHPLKRT